jgi:multisubunit Na+/H+ antiporter MnhC subunit
MFLQFIDHAVSAIIVTIGYRSRSIAPAATMMGHAESARSAPKSNASTANSK